MRKETLPSCDLGALERALGWRFRDPSLLVAAMTHSSYANENRDGGPHNERLEFLGDAVLGLLAARLLFDCSSAREGELSRMRSRVVRTEAFAEQANELSLGVYLRLGEGQRRASGAESKRLLEDAFEALAGAVFADGGYAAAEQCFAPRLIAAIERDQQESDWKSVLQETCHSRHFSAPCYSIVTVSGPDHARRYTCEVSVNGVSYGTGEASSKKAAEQLCAENAVRALSEAP